jgi:perosamine synthetase
MDVKNVAKDEAIFAVHNLGNIINIPNLKKKFDCAIIEDNCEGFFGRHGETSSGSESLCSSLSFYGNKNITCGEGGAFMTNDEEIYKYALKLRGQGQSSERYIHDELGYNYRMTNVQAAILLGQLENIENKNRVFKRYANNLCNIPGIRLQKEEDNTQHSKWMFGVRFINLNDYKSAEPYFKKHGIDTRPMFYSFREHKHLNLTGEDKNAIIINKEVIVFPSYPELTDNEIDYICDIIIKFNNKRKI